MNYSVGDSACLSCKLTGYYSCSSITWSYSNEISKEAIELVTEGKVNDENKQKSGKLNVKSCCSLCINNLTMADTGHYYCRLYHDENAYTDAPAIHLLLLSRKYFYLEFVCLSE